MSNEILFQDAPELIDPLSQSFFNLEGSEKLEYVGDNDPELHVCIGDRSGNFTWSEIEGKDYREVYEMMEETQLKDGKK